MQFAFTIQPISVCLVDSSMGGEGKEMYFEKLRSLDEFHSINGDKRGLVAPWFGIRSVELLLKNYWMYFISLSASESICAVFNICNPTTAHLFVSSNGKQSVLPQCVILGIKTECPIYPEYNIATYLQRAAFLLPQTLHSCVFVMATKVLQGCMFSFP